MAKKVVKTTVTTISSSPKSRKKKTTKKKAAAKKATKKKVAKKKAAKKTVRKTTTTTISSDTKAIETLLKKTFDKQEKRDTLLVENFVGLQKAMATLSSRFSELSQNMSSILQIFEQSARILAESEKQVDATLTTKLDALIEQNKGIAREINLVDSKIRRTNATKPQAPSMYSRQIQPKGQPQSQRVQGLPPKELPQP